MMPRRPTRWVVRIVYPGGVAWLRHGPVAGAGPIARFTSKASAQAHADAIAPGLDEGCVVSVVPVGPSNSTKGAIA
jgi:hypothetical protein